MFQAIIEAGKDGARKGAKDSEREDVEKFVQALDTAGEQTLARGRFDQAFVFNRMGSNRIQFVGVMKIARGTGLRQALEAGIRNDPDAQKSVRLGAAQVGSVPVHAVTLPPDEKREKTFGRDPFHVAIGDDAAFVVLGEEPVATLKAAMEAKPAKAARAPVSLRIALARLFPLLEDMPPQVREMASTALSNGGDEIALEVVSQPQGVRLRLQLQEGVLRLLGLIGAARAAGQ